MIISCSFMLLTFTLSAAGVLALAWCMLVCHLRYFKRWSWQSRAYSCCRLFVFFRFVILIGPPFSHTVLIIQSRQKTNQPINRVHMRVRAQAHVPVYVCQCVHVPLCVCVCVCEREEGERVTEKSSSSKFLSVSKASWCWFNVWKMIIVYFGHTFL